MKANQMLKSINSLMFITFGKIDLDSTEDRTANTIGFTQLGQMTHQ